MSDFLSLSLKVHLNSFSPKQALHVGDKGKFRNWTRVIISDTEKMHMWQGPEICGVFYAFTADKSDITYPLLLQRPRISGDLDRVGMFGILIDFHDGTCQKYYMPIGLNFQIPVPLRDRINRQFQGQSFS